MTILERCSPFILLLDADWLQRVNCGALIGWSLQRVTSLRHAVAAKVLLLWNALRGLIRYRGNKYKLLNCTFCHDLRKYYFSARITNIWNSLPNCVVDVSTINQFKARLDNFWVHQDDLYDYTAELTGIGDRSVRETKDV